MPVPELSQSAPSSGAAREAVFTARDGQVYYRGVFRTPDECALLLAEFRRPGLAGDWFEPFARSLANELERAMRAAGYIQQQEKAA